MSGVSRRAARASAIAIAIALAAATLVHAQLYSETFPRAGAGDIPLSDPTIGWVDTSTGAGTSGVFDHTGSGIANEAATPDGEDAGVAFHYLATNGTRALYTTEFAPINPTGAGVDIIWYQTEDALIAGSTVDVHPAVMVGGAWYATDRAFTTTDNFSPWQRNVLAYSPAAANWRQLALDIESATMGAPAASNLSGNIEGLGLVTVMSTAPLGNEAVWYDYIEIATHVIPGDVNGVGGVTIADYEIIRANYRTNVTMRSQGDLNDDGFVDLADFREWKANAPPEIAAGLEIPEPAGSALAAAAALGCAMRRGRIRRSARPGRGGVDCSDME
jgi:hypothetical protein